MLRSDFSRRASHTAVNKERYIAWSSCEDITNKFGVDHRPSLVLHGSLMEDAIERVPWTDLMSLSILFRNLGCAPCPRDDDHLRRGGGYILGDGFWEFGEIDYGKLCGDIEMVKLAERLVYGDNRIVVDEAVSFLRSQNRGGAVGELHQSKGVNIG